MPKLSVNLDHIATLRQARRAAEPDPAAAAVIAELAGALGITVHLRSDRRHIQDRDVAVLRQICRTRLDLEMAATDPMIEFAIAHRPDLVTLVPERPEEVTTEGGLNVAGSASAIRHAIDRLSGAGLTVSIFLDPDPAQVRASREAGAKFIEINTGRYADASSEDARTKELLSVANAARIGREEGLRLAAGHGLDYRNVTPVASLPDMEELNIGHSIIARGALVGLAAAVTEMCGLIASGR